MDNLLEQTANFLPGLLDPLEVTLLITALWITVRDSVKQIIVTYRIQSYLLAVVTGMTALIKLFEQEESGFPRTVFLILLTVILPVMLALFIEPILVRATLAASSFKLRLTEEEKGRVTRIWRKTEAASNRPRDIFIFVSLVGLAFLIAFQIIAGQFQPADRVGLMVSLTLHLTGLYNMMVKRDIISQIVGLLIMDHGLYLAVVKIVAVPVPATFFVISLYFYTLITIVILVLLLPRIRRLFGSTDLSEIAGKSRLEG